uniref:Putative secreted protein n=1 Tax=Ixodes ricinus TaxID=34613 RepID=A0A6B0UN59_IXORI
MEQGLAADGVAQVALAIVTLASAVHTVWALRDECALRWRQCLKVVWSAACLSVHRLEQALIAAHHFAGVAFDPSNDLAVPSLEAQRCVDRLETTALEKLHDNSVMTITDKTSPFVLREEKK